MPKFRKFTLSTGSNIFLGKDSKTNDELMKKYEKKENFILHTVKPGSPFCVIENFSPTKKEIKEAAIICAAKSQDWRDNKKSVKLHLFTGKNIKKDGIMKQGTWGLKIKPKVIKAKKKEIRAWQSEKYN
jgi:predicted ribosome quality control (RQC) complex YloA/Tae2 family protein